MSFSPLPAFQAKKGKSKHAVADCLIQSQEDTILSGDGHGSSKVRLSDAGHWADPAENEVLEGPKPAPRRRRPSGNDLTKHRRTRNGCYTCRSRRVKCDEIRPICQRCTKGKRECTYPEPRENMKSSGTASRGQPRELADDSQTSSGGDDSVEQFVSVPNQDTGREARKPSLGSRKKPVKHSNASLSKQQQQQPSPPSTEQLKMESSLSPSTDASSTPASVGLESSEKFSSVSTEASQEDKTFSHLAQDLQYYIKYHKTQLTYHHYNFKHDANHFLHHILVEQALNYDPLLYALVGFAAFQSTIKRSNGKIQDFLLYYNTSVSLLRKSLRDHEKHTDATMLTILQLATFEDHLGDWVSLLGHQKAAHGMLLELYTPDSIMETELRRKILAWYLRFDVAGGLMAGHSAVLGREWFLTMESYYRQQSLSYPMSIDYKIEASIALHRLLAGDLALLYVQLPRGDITVEEFTRESERYSQQIDMWRENLDPIFRDESYLVKSFEGRKPDPEDIVNPYMPGYLCEGAMFTLNFMVMDWYAINLMHKHKTAVLLHRRPPPEVRQIAFRICQLFEAMEYWPQSPPGVVIKNQGTLGLAILFLPRDEKHVMWCRRKLAKVESLGHIYPAALRHKMADEWNVPEINDWWLPAENACPPVVRSIHTFMKDRVPQEDGQSRNEDQRNLNGIFSKLSIVEKAALKDESVPVGTTARPEPVLSQVDALVRSHEDVMMNGDVDM